MTVDGTISITFVDNGPVILEVDGAGAVHGFQIATAKLVFQTDGYFEVDGNVDIDLGIAGLKGGLAAFVDVPHGTFAAEAMMELSLFGYGAASADTVISSIGIATCGSFNVSPPLAPAVYVSLGAGYKWGGDAQLLGGVNSSCDVAPYRVHPVSDRAVAADRRAHAHEAVASLVVPRGTPFEDILVAGAWGVLPATGSAPITSVSAAAGLPPAAVKAHVSGLGRSRVLRYLATPAVGRTITFAEQGRGVYHAIGVAGGSRGTLRFTPADGPSGLRTIVAIVSESGLPRKRLRVARYLAPGPAIPGRVRGLHVTHRGRTFTITFGTAPDAARYILRITASDGRRLLRLLGARGHVLRLPVVGFSDRISVTVTGLTPRGVQGPARQARAG